MLEPEIRQLDAIRIVGVGGTFRCALSENPNPQEKIPPIWDRFIHRVGEISDRAETALYGVSIPMMEPQRTSEADCYYLAGAVVTSNVAPPAGMDAETIPAATYAVFTHRGPISAFPSMVQRVHREWLPASQYRPAGGPELERYDDRFDGDSETSELELWVPVVER